MLCRRMKHRRRVLASDRRGTFLIISYTLVAFLTAWSAGTFKHSLANINLAQTNLEKIQAMHSAEAGVNQAIVWMRSQPSPPAGANAFTPQLTGGTSANNGATYTVSIDPDDNNAANPQNLYTITVSSTVNNVTSQIQAVLRTESYARYAYFTDSEETAQTCYNYWFGSYCFGGSNIWFTTGDVLNGPVRSNDQFNMNGTPVFNGDVTSAAATINYYNNSANPTFNGDLTLSASSTTVPMAATELRVGAVTGGQWYEGDTTITLQADGSMLVTNATNGWTNQVVAAPANGAIFVNGGDAMVSGTLDGSLTIGTSDNIVIEDHIDYAVDPQVDPTSDDMLGLIAEQEVQVPTSAPSNLRINASVMAIDESFDVVNSSSLPNKGNLTIYGGLIQTRRGTVGTISGNGYTKDYHYDDRLAETSPPFYPTTGEYEIVMWQQIQ